MERTAVGAQPFLNISETKYNLDCRWAKIPDKWIVIVCRGYILINLVDPMLVYTFYNECLQLYQSKQCY